MRNFLIIVVGILVLNAVFLYSGGFAYLKKMMTEETPAPKVQTDINEVFKVTLEKEVQLKIGTPIEGYEPQMFLQVFPGLVETDFNNVEASIGKYVMVDGRLQHQMDDAKLVHSAARAITRRGMETLLTNIATRIGVDLNANGTLTEVMSAITGD